MCWIPPRAYQRYENDNTNRKKTRRGDKTRWQREGECTTRKLNSRKAKPRQPTKIAGQGYQNIRLSRIDPTNIRGNLIQVDRNSTKKTRNRLWALDLAKFGNQWSLFYQTNVIISDSKMAKTKPKYALVLPGASIFLNFAGRSAALCSKPGWFSQNFRMSKMTPPTPHL